MEKPVSRMTRAEGIDASLDIVLMIGAEAFTAWAKTVPSANTPAEGQAIWSDALEAKLLEVHNRQTRAQDRATYERLMGEYMSQKSELRFREALEAAKA